MFPMNYSVFFQKSKVFFYLIRQFGCTVILRTSDRNWSSSIIIAQILRMILPVKQAFIPDFRKLKLPLDLCYHTAIYLFVTNILYKTYLPLSA